MLQNTVGFVYLRRTCRTLLGIAPESVRMEDPDEELVVPTNGFVGCVLGQP